MCALRERVYPSVRSPGAVNAGGLAADTLECPLEMILNRVAMGLTLPARKSCPVVGDSYF